jgi:hypothetical protein
MGLSPAPLATEDPRPSGLIEVLVGLAIAVGLVTLVGLVAAVVLFSRQPDASAGLRVLAVTCALAAGLAAVGLILAAIGAIRRLNRLSEQTTSLEQHTSIQAQRLAASHVPGPKADADEVRMLLAQIEEILLLPEDHRRRRFDALMDGELKASLAAAEKLANSNDFHRARERLQIFTDRFGAHPRVEAMQAQIEKQAQAAHEMDLNHARDQLKDLIAMNQWDQAELLTRELAERYPNSQEPMALFQHVCRERQIFEQGHRGRLHEEIQQLVKQRRWQEAAQAARQFMATFPTGPDTEALRAQLETLEANAEIQTRQQLESQIKEHLRRLEYWDALALARRIIADYPFSPQANALRNQLPRLEELARGHRD